MQSLSDGLLRKRAATRAGSHAHCCVLHYLSSLLFTHLSPVYYHSEAATQQYADVFARDNEGDLFANQELNKG